jgi:CubicO group peptidase (beta-lactamase class C family)
MRRFWSIGKALGEIAGPRHPTSARLAAARRCADCNCQKTGKLVTIGMPLVFDPGDRWLYGINIDWAGRLVEATSGQPLDVYFRDKIFAPLGMNDSGTSPRPSTSRSNLQNHRYAKCKSTSCASLRSERMP